MIGRKLDHIDIRILKLFSEPRQPPNKAKVLSLSNSALSHRLKTLTRHGYLVCDSNSKMHAVPLAILNSLNISKLPTYRIHNLWLTFRLKDSIDNDTSLLLISKGIKLSSSLALRNHTDSYFVQDGYEARLNPSSLEIHLPDIDGLPLDTDLRAKALEMFSKLENTLLKLENKLGIHLLRVDKDTIIAKISHLHIALKDHPFAELVNENGKDLRVYVDGELRVIVDKSHGFNEFEPISATYAIDDAQKLGKLTRGVITGGFDYEKANELIHMLIELQTRTQEQLSQLISLIQKKKDIQ